MLFTNRLMETVRENSLGRNIAHKLDIHRGKYIFQGVAFVVAGTLAAVFPAATALNVELIIGVVLLLTGVLQLFMTVRTGLHGWSLLSAFLSIGIGLVMMWQPLPVLLALITLLAIFMTIEGILELFLAYQFRPLRNWGWMLFSGLAALAMAGILWIGFPVFDVMYLGCLIAINLVLYGCSLLMLVWGKSS